MKKVVLSCYGAIFASNFVIIIIRVKLDWGIGHRSMAIVNGKNDVCWLL